MSFYSAVKSLFYPAGRWYFGMRVEGACNVPPSGAAILVANHVSWLDPVVLGSACPRPVRFLIARRIYMKAWSRWFYDGMRVIPVETGSSNPRGLRAAVRALAGGEIVGVFPEGIGLAGVAPSRQPQAGAMLLAALSGAPILPAGLGGTREAWPPHSRLPRPGSVSVRFGSPYRPWERRARPQREELRRTAAEVMTRIQDLARLGA